jgi:hypothetical protein
VRFPRNQARSARSVKPRTLLPDSHDANDLRARKARHMKIRVDLARRFGVFSQLALASGTILRSLHQSSRIRIGQPRAVHAGCQQVAGNPARAARGQRARRASLERGSVATTWEARRALRGQRALLRPHPFEKAAGARKWVSRNASVTPSIERVTSRSGCDTFRRSAAIGAWALSASKPGRPAERPFGRAVMRDRLRGRREVRRER